MWSSGNKWLLGHQSSGVFMGQETWDAEPTHVLQPSYVVLWYYFNMWRWIGKSTVGSKFHDLFNEGKWLLLPEPHILDLYLHGRGNPMSVPSKTSVHSIIFELSIIWDSPLAGTILQVHHHGTKWHGFSSHHMPHYRWHRCHDGTNTLISLSTPWLHTLPSSPSLYYLPHSENGIEIFGVISKVQSHFGNMLFWSGLPLPHSDISIKGRYDKLYPLSGNIIEDSSHCRMQTIAQMVQWLNLKKLM